MMQATGRSEADENHVTAGKKAKRTNPSKRAGAKGAPLNEGSSPANQAGVMAEARAKAKARTSTQEAKPRTRQPKVPKDPIAESMKTPLGQLKVKVAEELGLVDKVRREGWGGLSAAETGRVGGIMTRILRRERQASTGEGSLSGKG